MNPFKKSDVMPGCWREIVGLFTIIGLGLCAIGAWLT